jgi:2,3-bisphosphoglycerate-dependent phosphoglycerate mutase
MSQNSNHRDRPQLVLVRHCHSSWNNLNLFTGWVDVPLSRQGLEEAHQAGELLKDCQVDYIFTSELLRAKMTAAIIHSYGKSAPLIFLPDEKPRSCSLKNPHAHHYKQPICPAQSAWELNERCYGDLQGLDKEETAQKYGADLVQQWRRSYDLPPPGGESLAMTAERAIPYFQQKILPLLQAGKNVLVAAHGNSLRAIIMHLEQWTPEQILKFELATGKPRFYSYNSNDKACHFTSQY